VAGKKPEKNLHNKQEIPMKKIELEKEITHNNQIFTELIFMYLYL